MDSRGKITLALLGAAVLAGTALGLGVGRPPLKKNLGVEGVRAQASSTPGRAAFMGKGCAQCHGAGGGGSPMGPGLGQVVAEYFAEAKGDRAAAKERLVRYLTNPKQAGTLRKDPSLYPNPMPSAPALGFSGPEIEQVAEFLLDMKPPTMAVGGDASGR